MPRVFPHDLEAERSLLGSMLISKEACQDILNKCEDRDFYEESHKVLFNAMSELSRQNIPVDVTTITSYLLDHSQLDKVGGVEYLRQLSDSVPTLAHSEYYLKIIHNKSILRKIINETTKIAENAFGDIEDIDGFIDESEKRGLYRSSVSSEICDSAIEILDAVDDMFQEKMTSYCFSKGIVALGFFSICFLTFTERAYQHCKENYSVPFQTIQNGLISLLEAVKTFLCPEQPEQSERKNFSMQEHTKTAESTSNAGKPKPHPSGKSASRIRNGFIASKYWDEMIAKMPCIDNTEALKNLIKRKVEEYVDALSLRKLLKDGDIKCMCDDLHIGVNTRYAPIIAMLAKCAAVLKCSSISEEANKEANKLYNEWYNEAEREANHIQNDEQEVTR